MRAFGKSVLRTACGLVLWGLLLQSGPVAGQEGAGNAEAGQAGGRKALIIDIEGVITPLSGAIWKRKYEEAKSQDPDIIILRIDSPGGYLSTTMELVDMLQRSSDVETVAYIEHEAISGAALTALAADKIVLSPTARFGDAGLIVEGDDSAFRYADAKARSALVAQVRTIAETAGRPPALAEAMVDKDSVVFEATHREDDRRAYFTEDEWKSLKDVEQWERGKPVFESKENRFLTLSGRRAVELGLANGNVDDTEALARLLNAEYPITEVRPGKLDTAVVILNDPIVTGLLLIVGLGALVFELSAPGLGIGGILSTLCFGTFFWSRFLGGTAGWLEVMLFLLGLVFIAMEFFVIPGFGIAGVSGIGMLLVSLVMASRHVVMPESARDLQQLGVSVGTVLVSLLACVVIIMLFFTFSKTLPGPLGRMALQPPTAEELSLAPAASVPEEPGWAVVQAGDLGRTLSALRPSGKAMFGDEAVDVVTEGDFVDPDQPVRVIKKSGTRVVVRQA
ncbi:NfeD family protein [Roseimaritima ulvae]|uniref:Uncharacterized protein n=1 Tax=Roseimaritima ulvae TaxID=980254 RepID=A0A5B9QKC8_9BACT|nr:NfeD family protein [Roseimaritima ulvae]QEG39518.1 hypothetical protein UC8_15130 [Roseimaritima ulvae]